MKSRPMKRSFLFYFFLAVVACLEVPTTTFAADTSVPQPRLDPNFFKTTPDESIPHVACNLVHKLIHYDDLAALKLPRHWRAIATLYTLESLQGEGGLEGFFTNTDGVLDATITEDLVYVGATSFLKLFTEARGIFHNSTKSKDAIHKELDRLDNQYSDLNKKKGISDFIRDFMKSHQALFLK